MRMFKPICMYEDSSSHEAASNASSNLINEYPRRVTEEHCIRSIYDTTIYLCGKASFLSEVPRISSNKNSID